MTGDPPSKIIPSADWRVAVKARGGNLDAARMSVSAAGSTVMLAVDFSGSMSDLLGEAQRGAIAFAKECVSAGRRVGLIGFGSDARLLQAPSRDPSLIERAFPHDTWGSTAMHAAIYLAAEQLPKPARGHAICIVTDGFPDDEGAALATADKLKRDGVDILTIGVDGADQEFLRKLASRSQLATKASPQRLAHDMKQSAQLLLGVSSPSR